MWNKKNALFIFSFLFLLSNAHAVTVFSDDFASGTLTGYDTNSGTWSAATNQLVGAALDTGAISHTISMPAGADYNISYKNDPGVAGQLGRFDFFTDQNGISNINGYNIFLQGNLNARLRRMTNGAATNLISGGVMNIGVMHDVNLNVKATGLMTLYVDGNTIGSATDTTYTTGTRIVFSSENAAGNAIWDNVIITTNGVISPTISVDYNGFGTDTNNGRKFVNTLNYHLTYSCFSGTGYIGRFINSTNDLNYAATCSGTTQNIFDSYQNPTNGTNYIIDFNIFDTGFGNSATTVDANFWEDSNSPTADLNQTSSSSGFSPTLGNATLHFTCFDEVSTQLDYNVFRLPDLTRVYSERQNRNTTVDFNAPLNSPSTTFNGICTDLAGNSNSDLNTVSVQANCFTLVDESSGVPLSGGDFTQFSGLKATAYSNSATYNFKTGPTNSTCFTGQNGDTIRFDLNYTDGTQLFREFNQDILTHYDANVPVCAADLQSFFEQDFTSSKNTPVVLIHQLSHCFNAADYTKYAEGDALSLRAFTIVGPYYMETFDEDGNKITLAQINGGTPSGIQIDLLKFKIDQVPVNILNDYLGVSLYLLPGQTDSNILKFYYVNYTNDNAKIQLRIEDDSNVLFDVTETTSPNLFVTYFDYTNIQIDGNILTVTLIKTKIDGSVVTEVKYISLNGIIQGAKGVFGGSEGLGAIAAIIIFIFGFTMVAPKFALGWVGIIVALISLIILSLTSQAWYILWLQAVFVIIAAYLAISYKDVHAGVS